MGKGITLQNTKPTHNSGVYDLFDRKQPRSLSRSKSGSHQGGEEKGRAFLWVRKGERRLKVSLEKKKDGGSPEGGEEELVLQRLCVKRQVARGSADGRVQHGGR